MGIGRLRRMLSLREALGLECAGLPDWSVQGSRTGVCRALGLECAGLLDWSAQGSWTGVRKALGLECARLMPLDVSERAKERAFITAQNAFLDKIHFAQL